jgi:hypothetical protein
MKQGIHFDVDEAIYHADPCPKPSLSCSLAKIIWKESSLHAWEAHPKLNPDYEPTNKRIFDLGSASHAVLLERGESKLVVIDADSYRTNKSKHERNEAYD